MDIANKLFSLTLGVEPNKQTLKGFAEIMNDAGKSPFPSSSPRTHTTTNHPNPKHSPTNTNEPSTNPVLSLSDKQKLLDQYAETAQSQTYTAAATPPTPKPKIIYRDKKEIKVFRIDPAKLKELQWKRQQLLEAAKAQKEAKDAAAAKGKKAAAPAASQVKSSLLSVVGIHSIDGKC